MTDQTLTAAITPAGVIRCTRAGQVTYRAAITLASGVVRHSRRRFGASAAAALYGLRWAHRVEQVHA